MSSPSSSPLIVETHRRRVERTVGVLTICGGVLAPWLVLHLEAEQAAAVSALVAVALALGFLAGGWWGRRRVIRVSWIADGRWMLGLRNGLEVEAYLDPQTRVAARIVWLRWRSANGAFPRYGVLLTRADIQPDDLRRLVVRLRLDGPADAGRPAAPAIVVA